MHRAAQDQAVQQVHPRGRADSTARPSSSSARARPRARNGPPTIEKHAARRVRERLSPNASLPNSLVYTPDRGLEQRRRLALPHAGQEPLGPRQQVAAGHVPGGDRGGRVPAGRRYLHPELRHQPVRLLGLHGRRQGPVDGGDDQERRGEGLDDAAPRAPQRAGRARRPRQARLPPDERPRAALPRPAPSPAPTRRSGANTGSGGCSRPSRASAGRARRSSATLQLITLEELHEIRRSGCTRSTSSTTACRGSTRR